VRVLSTNYGKSGETKGGCPKDNKVYLQEGGNRTQGWRKTGKSLGTPEAFLAGHSRIT
jgi:hypothetical protein